MATDRSMFRMPDRQYGERWHVTKAMMVRAIAMFTAQIGFPITQRRLSSRYGSRMLYGVYASLSKRGVWPWRFVHLMRENGHDVWPAIIADALESAGRRKDDGQPLVIRIITIHGEFFLAVRTSEEECLRSVARSCRLRAAEPSDILAEFMRAGGRMSRLRLA